MAGRWEMTPVRSVIDSPNKQHPNAEQRGQGNAQHFHEAPARLCWPNIPAGARQLPMNGEKRFRPTPNDFGEIGCAVPKPPPDFGPHRYYSWLYALDNL
ncbi:hypothetical protein [Halochromatium glycolicum]|uniref:hypothetical protein n=1 Tax=Halochromatium glycolicum TaxID=85075 RepID=UPI003B82D59B